MPSTAHASKCQQCSHVSLVNKTWTVQTHNATQTHTHCHKYTDILEGSLEVKLPTIWTAEKKSKAEAERRERLEERRSEKRKSQKKEDADARQGRKVAKHCVFPMICGSGGSTSRLAKAAGAEPAGQMRDEKIARRCGAKHISKSKCTKHTTFGPLLEVEMSKKCTPLWRRSTF